MYTKHHNYSCDGLHFATFMFLLVHCLYDCQCEFFCAGGAEMEGAAENTTPANHYIGLLGVQKIQYLLKEKKKKS